jgi:transposase
MLSPDFHAQEGENHMKKVELKDRAMQRYEIVKSLVEHGGNKSRAALRMGCSRATVYRMIRGYKAKGKEYFIHGNAEIHPAIARTEEEKKKIVEIYNSKYWDANYTFFSWILASKENITASPSLVRSILMRERILSPLARRKTKREFKKRLENDLKQEKKKTERSRIEKRIVAAGDAHPRRPRAKYFGEIQQTDASLHEWFGSTKSTLHIAIDDASGVITGAYFCMQETLEGYYNVFRQILTEYGIPYMFLTDRRTIFTYRQKGGDVTKDTFTQFGYACRQLGAEIRTSSIPQAKGRVERAFGTLQRRLPILLRTAGVTSPEQANTFLNSYIKEHNANFARNPDDIPSAFEKQPTPDEINRILSVLAPRTVDAGHAVSIMHGKYIPVNASGSRIHFRKGTKGLSVRTLDGRLFFSVDDRLYALEEIKEKEEISHRLDNIPAGKPSKHYVPPLSHPWKSASFERFMKQQPLKTPGSDTPSNE